MVLSLTLKNRNALPDLPHTAFPLERLFPGTNWTLNPSCQSLFPGLFQRSGLRGHRWAAWKSFRDAEHTVAVGHWTLAFFLKCQNPDFYCKTCSLQYSMSVSSRQESLVLKTCNMNVEIGPNVILPRDTSIPSETHVGSVLC